MCTVTVAVQNETSELSGHGASEVTFPRSGPILKSNSLIDTDKSSTKRLLSFMKQRTVIF
jgi:hypothetical protein